MKGAVGRAAGEAWLTVRDRLMTRDRLIRRGTGSGKAAEPAAKILTRRA
jgi:hypothetical protein